MSAMLSPSISAPSSARPVKTPRVSIVIPTYNEEGNIPILDAAIHAALAKAGIADYELVHVDDGSTDRSADEVRAEIAKDRRVRLLRLERNSGETAATEAGIRNARGEVVVVIDGDLQNDPDDIPRLLAKVGDYDCVCGYRPNRDRGDSAVRVVASKIANGVRNALSGDELRLRDSGCTFRAFKRECARNVKFFRGMHRFLPTLFRLEGYTVGEIPVNHRPRKFGRSKYGILDRALAASYDLVAVRWMKSRTIRWEIAEEAPAAGAEREARSATARAE